jgi:hypothetical protein
MEELAATTGQIIGTSLSPEMWGAVAAVVYYGRAAKAFAVALVIATAALLMLRFMLMPDYPIKAAGSAIVALALWSSIGWGIRVLLSRLRARAGRPAC